MQLTWKLHTPTKAEYKATPEKYRTHSHEAGRDAIEHGRIICCYSRCAVTHGFDNASEVWTQTLRNTRGLVFDHNDNVLCRGLPKFFNLGENELAAWNPDYAVMDLLLFEKFNGFCCHIWWDETRQEWRFTTKGGSEHEFEEYGKDLFNRGLTRGFSRMVPPGGIPLLDKSKIYIAEGCHELDEHTLKSNPGLYLIGIIDKATWTMTIDTERYPGEVIQVNSLEEALALQKDCKHEGYVMYVSYQGDVRDVIKFKSPFYVETRKQKALLDKKSSDAKIWEDFSVNPDDRLVHYSALYAQTVLGDFFDDWWTENREIVGSISESLTNDYHNAVQIVDQNRQLSRKEFYELVSNDSVDLRTGLCMAVLDGSMPKVNGVLRKLAKEYAEKLLKPKRIGDDDA